MSDMSQPPFPPPPPPPGYGYPVPYQQPWPYNLVEPVPLNRPHYGISLGGAMGRFFSKYATFSGRASKSEYWWVILGITLIVVGWVLLAVGLVAATGGFEEEEPPALLWVMLGLLGVFWLGIIVPSIAVTVRRLHDADLSGWFYLLTLIPYLGGLILLVFALLPSKPAGARFDDDAVGLVYAPPPYPPMAGQPPYPPYPPAPPQG